MQPVDPALTAFLSNTPVTLMDWGMLRLDREVRQAVAALEIKDGRDGPVKVGTSYRPFDRRVLAYLSVPMTARERNLSRCRDLYGLLREHLLAGAPGGLSAAGWYLQRIFAPDGRGGGNGRPEPFGDMLVNMVLLEVTLRVPEADAFAAGPPKVTCAGRLDQEEAVEVQPWRPPG
ncbi:hypothetical protein CHU95_18295 [Niveispirillum lacus]|uniref:Uncharacterized protein n=1 Tax=Niveispirillum lacus TaxID=1981099 RepID=A0A255YU43_9PROT|nr:hypothetical protein [Niveispirillum lacus]OYQ32711.1 hypothetical protein CHU95_18295 [Niveispirillum lacus]